MKSLHRIAGRMRNIRNKAGRFLPSVELFSCARFLFFSEASLSVPEQQEVVQTPVREEVQVKIAEPQKSCREEKRGGNLNEKIDLQKLRRTDRKSAV